MSSAKWLRWGVGLGLGLSLLLSACGGDAPAGGDSGGGGDTGGGAAATPTTGIAVPEHVPILAGAYDLTVTADGTYIAYKADEAYDAAVEYYQSELVAQGWEQINKNDAAFGESITLLRSRPEANISITIQSVPGDAPSVRVLISLTKK
ncbi:MAG: hypothetical protein IT317_02100 [Anaerolineales bacterium]|nr:hypothetical protein [Anaerolineales bacterium]